jgi:outer membrane protein
VKPFRLVAGELLRRRFGDLFDLLPKILVFTAIAARVLAQNQPPVPVSLTLSDAVKLALKQNPQRVISAIRAMESERDRQAARAALLPQAGISASQFVSSYNLQTVEQIERATPSGRFQALQGTAGFSQSLLDFGMIRRFQIGREGVTGARARENVTREDVTNTVVAQYLLVLRAFATYDAARSRVVLAQRLFDQAVHQQATGLGVRIDAVRANVELQNEQQRLIDAETLTKTTSYVLAELLDLPRDQEIRLTDRLEFFDLPSFDRAALIEQALAKRPEMKAVVSDQRVAALARQAAGEQRLPRLGLAGDAGADGSVPSQMIHTYAIGFSLDVPIYTGGRIQAEMEKAKLEELRIAEQRRAIESGIVREVKSALEELEAAKRAVRVANLGLDLANDEVGQAERRFTAGVTTNIEVITAQDELARASDNQIQALYRFNQSRANLAHALGEIESTYVK